MDKDRKAAFIRSCRGLGRDLLKDRMVQCINKDIISQYAISLCNTAQFLNSPDLKPTLPDREGEPGPLQESYKNWERHSRTKQACHREDMEYNSDFEAVEALREKRRMDLPTEEPIRDTKKRKAAAEATMAGDASAISFRSHRKMLVDCFEFLNTSQVGLQTLKTTITDLGKWIAPVVNERLHELEVLQTATRTRCDEIKETDSIKKEKSYTGM